MQNLPKRESKFNYNDLVNCNSETSVLLPPYDGFSKPNPWYFINRELTKHTIFFMDAFNLYPDDWLEETFNDFAKQELSNLQGLYYLYINLDWNLIMFH